MGLTSLDKIRQQYGAGLKICPKCSHPLTIDKTNYTVSELCENCFDYAKIDFLETCCSSPSFQLVKHIISGGSIQVREQCQSCGFVRGQAIGGLTKQQRDELPGINTNKRDQRDKDCENERAEFYEILSRKRGEKLQDKKDEWMASYSKYLNSQEWKNKRLLVLKRDKYLCQCCLDAYATQVHHKSYEFVDLRGNEPSFDLVSICVPCHERIENMKNAKRDIKEKPKCQNDLQTQTNGRSPL